MYQGISDQGTSNNFNQHNQEIIFMRSSKDRTIEKKRRSKAMKVQKTEASRRKRLANKAKREEIHAVDPSVKITIVNGIPHLHNKDNDVVELVNGIYTVVDESTECDYDNDDLMEEMQKEIVIDNIKTKNKSALERLTDRFKKKKIEL